MKLLVRFAAGAFFLPAFTGALFFGEPAVCAAATPGFNLDRQGFERAFGEFVERCGREPESRLLFYFSRHVLFVFDPRFSATIPGQHPQFGTIGNPRPDQGAFVFAGAGVSPAGTSAPANAPSSAPPSAQSTPSSDEVTGQGATALPADPRPGDTWTEPGTGMVLVWLPGGEFTMGTNYAGFWAEGNADEKPEHPVRLDGFWLGKSEVTQRQWRLVTGGSPSRFGACGDDCPVESVTWEDAQKYVRKLAGRTGLPFRLPTEAEWEYAARGGRAQQKWAGTEQVSELGEYAWYIGNGEVTPHPVCTKRVNRFGLCDMSGNVWEWCSDWYGELYYETSPRENPPGSPTGSRRIFRGGGWGTEPRHARATNRNKYPPGAPSHEVGLRLVVPTVQR